MKNYVDDRYANATIIVDKGNYVNSGLEYDFSPEILGLRNELIKKEFEDKAGKINIEFLTESLYASE